MAKKEVAKVKAGGVPVAFDYGDDAGAGFEGTTAKDLSIPFLSILQPLSPQVQEQNPKDAESGQIFNTVTRELTDGDEGVLFLPCHKEGPIWVEWVPRKKGGGFVGLHDPESDAVKQGSPIMNDEGKPTRKLRHGENELIETFYAYGLLLDPEDGVTTMGFAVVSFTSTKIKAYRDWITAMYTYRVSTPGGKKVNPPLFANRSRLKTFKRTTDAGTWYNFQIEPFNETWAQGALNPGVEAERNLMVDAKDFLEMVQSGMARAAFDTENAAASEGGGEDGGGSTVDGKPVPF